MSAHTPGPWRIKYGSPTVVVPGNDTHHRRAAIAQCALSHGIGEAGIQDAANAEFIVRACNAHDDLLGALDDLLGQVMQAKEGFGIYANSESMDESVNAARAAIAKAKGEA